MRWLVTGARGQLGTDLHRLLAERAGDEVLAVGSSELDISDRVAVRRAVADFRPDVIVNCAAYNAVDQAESDASDAHRVNAVGPALLAAEAARSDAKLIHISTDYVFDGTATEPYPVDAPTNPRSAYGRSKADGEQAVRELAPDHAYVVRTSWVYGAHGNNFVKTMAKLERSHPTLTVVDDQTGSPTWTYDLAGRLIDLATSDQPPAIYHLSGRGRTTWYGFTRAIFEELGQDPERVQPTTTDKFPRPAPRPAFSVLSDAEWLAAGLPPMMEWRDALAAAFAADRSAYLPD